MRALIGGEYNLKIRYIAEDGSEGDENSHAAHVVEPKDSGLAGHFVSVDVNMLVEKLVLSPRCPEWFPNMIYGVGKDWGTVFEFTSPRFQESLLCFDDLSQALFAPLSQPHRWLRVATGAGSEAADRPGTRAAQHHPPQGYQGDFVKRETTWGGIGDDPRRATAPRARKPKRESAPPARSARRPSLQDRLFKAG